MLTIDADRVLKRGDLVHTNCGSRRERTCIVLSVRRLKPTIRPARVKVWCERWWQIEPEMRIRLYRSAERNGGQWVFCFARYRAKHKPSFDQHLATGIRRATQ